MQQVKDDSGELTVYQSHLRERTSHCLEQLYSLLERLNPGVEAVGGARGDGSEGDSPITLDQLTSPSQQSRCSSAPLSPMRWRSLSQDELREAAQRERAMSAERKTLKSLRKTKHIEESLEDRPAHSSTVNDSKAATSHLTSGFGHSELLSADFTALKNELDQLKSIVKAQVDIYEAQVTSLRKDLSSCQRGCEEMKVHQRVSEQQAADALRASRSSRVAGMCVRCADHEAVLAANHTNLHVQAIDRLTKERDELLVALRSTRARQLEAQEKEFSAILKAKRAMEMEEEARLKQQRVVEQCEQLSRTLALDRERLKQKMQVLKAEAKEESNAEASRQTEELAKKVSSLNQHVAELEGKLERSQRESGSLNTQLENTRLNLSYQEKDHAKVYSNLQHQLTQHRREKEEAEANLIELKNKIGIQIEKAALEVQKLNAELVGCRQHLGEVQKDGQWREKAMSLSDELAKAHHQLHLTREEANWAKRTHEREVLSASQQAQERHRETVALLEAQHKQRVEEQAAQLRSHYSLIKKLEDESRRLTTQLEEMAQKHRSREEEMSRENRYLQVTIEILTTRCNNLEERRLQQEHSLRRMKDRCATLQKLPNYF